MTITMITQTLNKPIDIYLNREDLIPLSLYKQHMKYKWITFIKNSSYFIAQYKTVNVYDSHNFTLYHNKGNEIILLQDYSVNITTFPLISTFLMKGEYPENIIEINNGEFYLAATHIEKHLYANKDFVSKKIKPFHKKMLNKLSPGRVRLFGHNYIYISKKYNDFL